MSVYLLVTFIVVLVFAAVCGWITLDRYFEKKRDKRLAKLLCDDVIPTAEVALEVYTKELMNSVQKMTEDMVKGFTNND